MCYKEMKQQQSLIKTVKDADNQRRDNENNEREMQKTTTTKKKTKTERNKGNRSYSGRMRAK